MFFSERTDHYRNSAYHDNGERHRESRDASEEGRRSYESHRSWIHPHPELIRGDASVHVDEQTADCSTVQTADKPARHHQRHLLRAASATRRTGIIPLASSLALFSSAAI